MSNLAIIIPAYKEKYFVKSLESLANQTCNKFTVYVGDDNSPHNLENIVNEFKNKISIKYIKFSNNIGSEKLVNQWKRCVELSENEKWLWLFSDDDIADSKAVENFYITVDANSGVDVFRFNTCVIDGEDNIIGDTPVGPSKESSIDMAYNLLLGRRGNSMPDHIFSRKIYEEKGGFVFTKFAQAADWATSILFSEDNGICIIENSKMYWRQSGSNISSIAHKNKRKMIQGHFQFIYWIINHFKNVRKDSSISYDMILNAARSNISQVMVYHYRGIDFISSIKMFKLLVQHLNVSYYDALKDIYLIKKSTDSKLNRLVDFIKKAIGR